jgi:hypothetical protein
MNERITSRGFGWEQWVALGCFVAAVLSMAVGFVFTTGWLLNAEIHPFLHGVGLVLLIVGIPLLILGGHFMDLQERRRLHGCR